MRVGWIAAPSPVIKKFSIIKQMTDLHTNVPSQYILDSFLREGLYEDHIKTVCKEYAYKRDVMVKALDKKKNLGISFRIPQGGYYIWCKIPDEIQQPQLLIKSSHKGIVYAPGNPFYPEESDGNNYIRLNFTFENTKNISNGINRLLEAVEEVASETDLSFDYKKILKKPIV
jgi:DNA-binding transcriptional MocR family regulator